MQYANILVYADDVKIFTTVKSPADATRLKSDLMILTNWSDQNGLSLNKNKCNVISFYKGNNPLLFDYFINNDKLNGVSVIKDLGVLFDSSVTFESHINYIVSKSF